MKESADSARHRLTTLLRRTREATGRSQAEVATQLFWSTAKLSRLETGARPIRTSDLVLLLLALGVPAQRHEEYLNLAAHSRERSLFSQWSTWLAPGEIQYYQGLSAASNVMDCSNVVPLLLRTDAYQSAVLDAESDFFDSAPREVRWAVFEAARAILASGSYDRMSFVMSESALRRLVGGRKVMREQGEYLLALAELPHVFVGVVPFTAGVRAALTSPFTILEWSAVPDADMVCCPGFGSRMVVSRESAVLDRARAVFAASVSDAIGRPALTGMVRDIGASL